MDERLNAVVGAKIGSFRRKMAEVKAITKSLPNTVTTRVKVNYQQWRRGMDKIAEASRDFGEIIGRSLMGGIVAALPAVSNIIGVLAGGIGGLASSFVAAGGAAGAFGIAAIGNASKLAENMSEIKKINDKIKSEKQSLDPNQERINELLNERKNILGSLSGAQKSAMKQVNKFKDAWSEFLKVTQKPVFKVFAAGLKVATSLLDKMKPIIKPVSKAITGLLNQFNSFSNTKQFKSFIDFFANRGSSAIKNWGQIAGNILNGFMELMKAFGPLGKDMENGLIGMTKKFADWAAGLKDSKAFNKFINFIKENGPKVLDLIGNLTKFIVELGKGLAPLGSKILNIANSFFSWISGLMKGNPIIGQIVAWVTSLIGVFMALAPIILSVFSAFKLVFPIILRIGGILKWFIGGPIGLLVSALLMIVPFVIKHWDQIWKGTKQFFTKIGNFISDIWNAMWTFIKVTALLIAKWVVQKFTDIATGITKFMTNAWNTIKDTWNTVKTFWKAVLITIVKWVVQRFTNFTTKIADFMKKAHDTITGVWEAIKRFFRMILISIVRFVIDKFVSLVNGVRNKMNDALDFVTDIGGNIVDFFSDIDLFDSGKKIIQSAIDGILSVKDKITGVVGDIAGKVRDFWPFSPAKTGPLSDIHKMDFGIIGKSIKRAERPVKSSMANLAASARNAFKPDLAMANMSVGGTVDASINSNHMNAIQSGLSMEVSDFELPQQDEQHAVVNIGGHEAKGVITYITEEQKREQELEERFE